MASSSLTMTSTISLLLLPAIGLLLFNSPPSSRSNVRHACKPFGLLLFSSLPDTYNRALEPVFKTLGKAWWTKVPATVRDDHFFATLDYMQGKETFKKVHSYDSDSVPQGVSSISPSSSALTLRLQFTSTPLLKVHADQQMERLMQSL